MKGNFIPEYLLLQLRVTLLRASPICIEYSQGISFDERSEHAVGTCKSKPPSQDVVVTSLGAILGAIYIYIYFQSPHCQPRSASLHPPSTVYRLCDACANQYSAHLVRKDGVDFEFEEGRSRGWMLLRVGPFTLIRLPL